MISPWSDHALEPFDPVLVNAAVKAACDTHQKVVESYYQHFLRRPGEDEALAAWVESLQRGSTDAQVLAGIIGSEEYFQRAPL